MKTCLVGVNASYSHSSLSVRCLKKSAEEVFVKEFTINDSTERVIESICETEAELFAFSCYIWNIDFVCKVASAIKEIFPESLILFGGAEVCFEPKETLLKYPFVDMVLSGEGEISFKKLVSGEDYDNIPGLAYKKEKEIILNEAELVSDLDSLPRLYIKDDLDELKGKIIYYETSRGCPYNCSFCLSSTTRGVRFFSLERVFEDLKLFSDCGVKLVKFVDRTFNIDEERTNSILSFILEHTGQTLFHFEISAHSLKESTIELLKSAPKGKIQLEIGIQSTNEKTIKEINRTTDFEKVRKNVLTLAQNKNIHIHLDLIAGLPYEDLTSFKKSFDDVFYLKPDMLQLGFLKMLKGARIREEADKHLYKFLPYPPYEVVSNKYMTYKDISLLKGVCDMVERYYNSGAFEKSLSYLLEKCESPFLCFYKLYEFFASSGYKNAPQSRLKLYDILYEYEKDDCFSSYLLFDLLKNNKGAPLPFWAKRTDKEFSKAVSVFLSENRGVLDENLRDEKLSDIMKFVRVYPFSENVLSKGENEKVCVLFDYKNGKEYRIEVNYEE